jgi:hypothetical protein
LDGKIAEPSDRRLLLVLESAAKAPEELRVVLGWTSPAGALG